ncbi:alkaline phosphatase family protein [Fulvivirga sp. M361]|uniref:alkaline phosphatase family protein n=1 Tax=Fulvivirga sp. M361 TaxID=2594266 RepID=UPI00117B8034|nr:alkaline phosphatase family protein [Fulvivirga sp. M361]TRX59919.1 alkaline phosphatase family protein [Fulvivirga sp. M361]
MIKKLTVTAIFLVFVAHGSAQTKKAVFILLDGIPADVLEDVATPTLDHIARQGGYTRSYVGGQTGAYTETPTISAPGYMNMITGVWAYKHNVWGNKVKKPNYHYWNIFRIVERADPTLKTAIFSTWEDNRTKLIGEGKPTAGGLQLDHSFDGFEHDTSSFPHLTGRKFIFNIDEHVSQHAAEYIKTDAPDLSWVYLEYTDDMGHMYGDSPQLNDAIQKADIQVKRIWDAVQYRKQEHNEDWMLVVTTDHGRDSKKGKNHGGQSERERTTWIITNQHDLNARFNATPAIVDITPTLLRHLNITPSDEISAEFDGTPFLGKISVMNMKASIESETLEVTWDVVDGSGEVEIYHTTTNNFKEGKKDEYLLIGKADVKAGTFKTGFDLTSGTHKILLKAPFNQTNTWVFLN